MNHHILIDCDPGADDIFALLRLLVSHQYSDLPMTMAGITTVGGNVSADLTYTNALRMCEFVGITNIEVGKDHRQIHSQDASHIHGSDGIGNLSTMLPEVTLPDIEGDSVDMIVDAIHTHGSELIILVTGPMTNLALAETRHPGILRQCKKIIAMGGAISMHGNVTPVAEFNIAYDPTSAKIVFDATDNIILLPLDLTTSMVFTLDDMEQCFAEVNQANKQNFMRELTKFTIESNMRYRETGYEQGFYVHDAHTVGMLLYPHLYTGSFQQVEIETQGQYTSGQTIVDQRNNPKIKVNTFVAMQFDKKRFLEALTQDLRRFDFE